MVREGVPATGTLFLFRKNLPFSMEHFFPFLSCLAFNYIFCVKGTIYSDPLKYWQSAITVYVVRLNFIRTTIVCNS
jgi:hypothetical protein